MEKEQRSRTNPLRTVTAVVLSGGVSHNFTALTGSLAKPFIKVCGRTLLHHSLRNLTLSGFRDIIYLTNNDMNSTITNELDSALDALNGEVRELPNVLVYGVPCTEDRPLGTTEALKYITELLEDHFVIVPCDLFGVFDFRSFVEDHLQSNRLCTVALLANTQTDEAKNRQARDVCLGGNDLEDWSFKYRVVATLDETTKSILGITQMVSLENGERLELYKWHLARHPKCVINRELVDVHVYAFSNQIFKVVKSEALNNCSIRLDLVPYIVKMQETPMFTEGLRSETADTFMEDYDMETTWRLDEMSQEDAQGGTGTFYFVGSGDKFKCCRINSIDSFYTVNMNYCHSSRGKTEKKNPKVKNAVLGYKTEVPESSTVKNSVIGNNVNIGKNVKITDSVVMDNCTLGDNAVVEKSALGASVYVEEGAKLKNAVVRSGSKVPSNTTLEKDYLPPFIES